LPAAALVFAAELFPYTPPSPSQQRSVEQQPKARPQLSSEDLDRITKLVARAKPLNLSDQKELKNSVLKSLNEAREKGNVNQITYYRELLHRLE
jgi:hypothetical protein